MPTHRYLILCTGLFLGLFLLPLLLKAAEEVLPQSSPPPSVVITGYNVLCEFPENETTLTATTSLIASPSFRWYQDGEVIPGETTHTIIVNPTASQTTFSVVAFDASSSTQVEAQRTVFVTTRPTATRVNDTLCPGENRMAMVGMRNTDARHFIWTYDSERSPHMTGDVAVEGVGGNNWPFYRTTHHDGDSINIHVWNQPYIMNNLDGPRVVRTVFTAQMSTHPFRPTHFESHFHTFENRCFTVDSAMIEIGTAQFELVAHDSVCVGEEVDLTVIGDAIVNITWSTGATTPSISEPIFDLGYDDNNIFYVEVVDILKCVGRDTVTIYGMPVPLNVRIDADDLFVCYGSTSTLTVLGEFESVRWNMGNQTTETIEISAISFMYIVTAFGGPNQTGCPVGDTVVITAGNCDVIYFPTAIRRSSQNFENRVFRPILIPQDGTRYWFAIFNSWGQLIFESDQTEVGPNGMYQMVGWDGTYRGQNVRPGTYVFVFRLTNPQITWERTGTVTVID